MGYTDDNGRYRRTEQAYFRLRIMEFTLAGGTPLAVFADGASPTPGKALDDSESVGVRWNNHATPAAIWGRLELPADRKPNTDVIVHFKASKTGNTVGDATTFTSTVFFQPVGALRNADANAGGVSDAIVGNATSLTMQKVTRTIAAADIPNPSATDPCATASISIKPTDGTLGTDDITLAEAIVEYTRQDLAE